MPDRSTTNEVIGLAQKLIRFRTTSDRIDQIRKCIGFIKDYFADSNVVIREHAYGDYPSLFITFNKRKKQSLILNGHIDVVEGFDSQFIPKKEDGKIYARGSNDMKASVATMMVIMKNLSRKRKPPKVGLMIVSDEETGSLNGSKKLVKRGYTADFCIVGEPSKFYLETKHKGCIQAKITAYGRKSHSSRPWQGKNAIEILMRQYHSLLDEVDTATRKKRWLPTINPTNIIAEGPYNVTPSKAEMILDIRTNEDVTNSKMIALFKKLNFKYKLILNAPMMYNKKKNDDTRYLKKLVEHELGKKVKYIKSSGGTDGRYFTEKGVQTVVLGPRGKNHHKNNEYVEIKSLKMFYNVLDKFIEDRVD